MEPLSIASGILEITSFTLGSIRSLINTIDDAKGVPEEVSNIRSDLQALQPTLNHLEQWIEGDDKRTAVVDGVRPAVQNCGRACKTFQNQLDHWMRHSTGDKTFWVDRWKLACFGQKHTLTLRGKLSICKETLSVVMSSASFMALVKTEKDEEKRIKFLESQEAALKSRVQRAEDERNKLAQVFQQVSITANTQIVNNQVDLEKETSSQELLQEIQRGIELNDDCKKIFEELITRVSSERAGNKVSTKGTRATGHGQAYAGLVNSSREEFHGDIDVSDTTASDHGVAAAGVVNGVTFDGK